MMKILKYLSAVVCLCLICGAIGCGQSFARTADERSHMYKSVYRSEWNMAKDDIDVFTMANRRSRLTRWH